METKIIILISAIAVVTVLVSLFIFWLLSKRRVVKPSEVHVVRRSKQTEIYGNVKPVTNAATGEVAGGDDSSGNVYYHIPTWVPIWGVEVQVLPLHNFSVDLEDYEAYDKDKLPFVQSLQTIR